MKKALLFPPLMKIQKKDFIDFYEEFPDVRDKFELASDILGFDLAKKFYSDDEEVINSGIVARAGTVAICSSLYDMVKKYLPEFNYYLGPSQGLVNAIHCSGRMSFEETLKMIKVMVAIETNEFPQNNYGVYFFYNIDTSLLLEYMEAIREQGGILEPVMFGNQTQMIVNGDHPSLEKLSTKAATKGGLGVIVPYGPPSHCRLMKNVKHNFEKEYFALLNLEDSEIPLVSNVTGKEISSSIDLKHELSEQYTNPVLWYDSLKYIYSQGIEEVTVLGPGQFILKSLHFTDIPFKVDPLVTVDDVKNKLASLVS